MPQISKVRIVNFQYNDGKRLIADELYDFSNKEQDVAMNVLINLANGGGKSVLVQLMLQPMIPKAKVAGRKIESFFNKAGDHCFILLEWIKDNSTEKLLTGIAMASGEATVETDNNMRGMNVKYYTFYTNYSAYNSKFDIVNMALSRKEKDRFVPAEFDFVRDLSRKSNGVLNYYASDDSSKWGRKLAEYGIVQNEWRMIENLNSEEGGLGKFFGKFKSSDQLLDNLFIKTIEEKLCDGINKDDASLVTILQKHVEQHQSKQDVLREKESYEEFATSLNLTLKPNAEELWNANDKLNQSVATLFGFSNATDAKIKELEDKIDKDTNQLREQEKALDFIEWERVSDEYHRAKDEYENKLSIFTEAEKRENASSEKLTTANRKVLILESANYYKKLTDTQNQIIALKEEINRRESGENDGSLIASLKYSILTGIEAELPDCQEKYEQNKQTLETTDKTISKQSIEHKKADKKYQSQITIYNQMQGEMNSSEKETDNAVIKIDNQLMRRLDGEYAQDELKNLFETKKLEHEEVKDNLQQLCSSLEKTDNALQEIPQKLADINTKINSCVCEISAIDIQINKYKNQEEEIQKICTQHNFDFSLRFSDNLKEYLSAEEKKNIAQMSDTLRQISVMDEEILAANRGSIHVPNAVIEYLNSLAITYNTCEKYLLELEQSGKLSNERVLSILHDYPAVAYGILIDDKEKQKLFACERIDWLPAMIPLFNSEFMDKIINNEKQFSGSIAFYSEAYFSDKDDFLKNLENEKQKLENIHNLLCSQEKELKNQISCIERFTYHATWHSEQIKLIDIANNQKNNLDREKTNTEQKRDVLKKEKADIIEQQQNCDKKLGVLSRFFEDYETAMHRIKSECDLRSSLQEQNRLQVEFKDNAEKIKNELKKLTDLHNQTEGVVTELKIRIDEMTIIKSEVDACQQAPLKEGHWRDLTIQYHEILEKQNTEISQLNKDILKNSKLKEDYNTELVKRDIPLLEYRDIVYSKEQEDEARQSEKVAKSEHDDSIVEFRKASESKGNSEGKWQTAQDRIKQYGQPLEKSQIGTNFAKRIKDIKIVHDETQKHKTNCERVKSRMEYSKTNISQRLEEYTPPSIIPPVSLEEDYELQYKQLQSILKICSKALVDSRNQILGSLSTLQREYDSSMPVISNAIEAMIALLNSEARGDRYFTLVTLIDSDIESANRAIAQIVTDLGEYEKNHQDLIRQCLLQGQRIFEGLKQMSAQSKVTVYTGKSKQLMIKFNIPTDVDAIVAHESIQREIDQGIRELIQKSEQGATDIELKKIATNIVGSKNLFRKYIRQDSIIVQAYKIDQNPQNAGYRTWEQTQINNSGAEKFVVYFAVILALMSYTRSDLGEIHDKTLRSALILDNPFGATSSKHILNPMFEIAKHFNVQMVCLSDINKSDVINCFNIVIKAIVKKRLMSTNEILTHEKNELIEHGFYRAEQLSIL